MRKFLQAMLLLFYMIFIPLTAAITNGLLELAAEYALTDPSESLYDFFLTISAINLTLLGILAYSNYRNVRQLARIQRILKFFYLTSGLMIFNFMMAHQFLIASTPATTPVSLTYAFRPWWRFSNWLFAIIVAAIPTFIIWRVTVDTFPEEEAPAPDLKDEQTDSKVK